MHCAASPTTTAADPTLSFWKAGLAIAPLVFCFGLASTLLPSPRLPLVFGWLAIWGWAGTILLGTLARIVPFLVWFHRYSALVGRVKVPSMKALLPDTRVRLGFRVHLTGLALGAAAIATGIDPLARAAGAVLLCEGLLVGAALVHVLRQRPTGEEQALARPDKPAVTRMRGA